MDRPVLRYNDRVGVNPGGQWAEVLNSGGPLYAGSGQGDIGGVPAAPVSWHGRAYLFNLTVPPPGMVVFRRRP